MNQVWLFLSGLFFANGIPHFFNGISGKDFHNPFLHRWVPNVPSPVFNVIWGLLNFCLSIFLRSLASDIPVGLNWDSLAFGIGFAFASSGLSIYFHRRGQSAVIRE